MSATQLLYQSALDSISGDLRVAVVNAHADPLLKEISKQSPELTVLQHFKPEHDELLRLGLNCSQTLEGEFDLILLSPAKNKQQTLGWMAEAMKHLVDGGKLLMACTNNHGAKSYESALKTLAGGVGSLSKSKCRVFSARKSVSLNHELTVQWINDAKAATIESHGLLSQPGLFSWDRPDIGSTLLLKHLPDSLTGAGMDLCCGYGFLSAHILEKNPDIKSLYLIEADHMALNCAEANTKPWAGKCQPHWLDAASDPLPLKLDWIVCNPPFHTGQRQDIELGQTIVANGCKSLKRAGKLYLVANRKLPYEAVLDRMLMRHRIIVQEQGFKVIEATKGVTP
ncbi:MAG TPA: methyltransferase [Mariprofundaceae bacterium]|nr:methyltransferase [Mariprofundaceae bacterium]